MKKKILFSTILVSILLTAVPVEAQGTAKVSLISEDKVQIGDTFKVSLQVSDIIDTYDGVVSMGGRLSFDDQKLEFISGKAMEEPYKFLMNVNTMMIAGLDFTLKNGLYSTTEVYEFTFKALEEGSSNITLQKATLTDSKGYITTTVLDKNVEIVKEIENSEVGDIESPIISKQEVISDTKVETSNETIKKEPKKEELIDSKQEEEKTKLEEKNVTTSGLRKAKRIRRTFYSEKIQKAFKDFISQIKKLF